MRIFLDVAKDDFSMLQCFDVDVVFVVSRCFMRNFDMLQQIFQMLRCFNVYFWDSLML